MALGQGKRSAWPGERQRLAGPSLASRYNNKELSPSTPINALWSCFSRALTRTTFSIKWTIMIKTSNIVLLMVDDDFIIRDASWGDATGSLNLY